MDLFIFGCNKKSSGANELEFIDGDDLGGKESVNVVASKEEGLRKESETVVDLNNPVNENGSH